MESQNEFNTILTWLGVTLGVITLGAAIFAVFRLTNGSQNTAVLPPISLASSYPCPQVPPTKESNYNLQFQDRSDAKPNLSLQFSLPKDFVLCHVAVGDASQFRSWKIRKADDYKQSTSTREYTFSIVHERDGASVSSRKETYKNRLEAQKIGTDTITETTTQTFPTLIYSYTRDNEKLRQHEILINSDLTLLIWAHENEFGTVDEILKTLQIKPL